MLELDISDNEVGKGSRQAAARGADGVSAFLTCLYESWWLYPYVARNHYGGTEVRPLILRAGGNYLRRPSWLLKDFQKDIRARAELARFCHPSWQLKHDPEPVRLCQGPAPYQFAGQDLYYLVRKERPFVLLPGFDA